MKKLNKDEIMKEPSLSKVVRKFNVSYNFIEPIEDVLLELYDTYISNKKAPK